MVGSCYWLYHINKYESSTKVLKYVCVCVFFSYAPFRVRNGARQQPRDFTGWFSVRESLKHPRQLLHPVQQWGKVATADHGERDLAAKNRRGTCCKICMPLSASQGEKGRIVKQVRLCVCVWNICTDVKLRFCGHALHYFFTIAGGHGSIHQSVANEATDVWRGYAVWSTARTCTVLIPIFVNGEGLSQVPQHHHHFFKFTRSPQSEQFFLGSLLHVRRFIADYIGCIHIADFVADDNNSGFPLLHSILFFVMSIHGMEIIRENFHYS